MTIIEIIAAVFGIAAVWLTTRQSIWNWPIGLIQVVLYVFVFYNARLYSDMILHVIYVLLQFYGWYHWLHGGKDNTVLVITTLSRTQRIWTVLLALLCSAVWGYAMDNYTDAEAAYPDAFIAMTSLASQWLMTRKKLESWWGWIVVDLAAIAVYSLKDLAVTAVLYAVFLVLAVIGAQQWQRSYRAAQ